MGWSERDSINLERLANAMELFLSGSKVSPINVDDIFNVQTKNLEEEFFRKVMEVYYEEEQLIEERGGGKKSPIRVFNHLIRFYTDYFSEKIPGVRINAEKGGLMFLEKDGESVCALRVYTDLGYGRRGEEGYEDMKAYVQQAANKGIPNSNVYFLVITFKNSLDNGHVRKLMGYDISNKDLLADRDRLEIYVRQFVKNAEEYLPEPQNQLFFLCSDKLHPNVLEEAFLVDFEDYQWLRPSVSELINKISQL